MITVNRTARFIALLSACTLLFVLVACTAHDKKSAFEELSAVSDTQASIEVQKYRILYPSDASAELLGAIDTLRESIERKTGKTCGMTSADETISEIGKVYYIYVGNTEYARSYYDGLLSEDYIFRADEDCAVLGGLSDGACIAAINRFESDVLDVYNSESMLAEYSSFEYRHIYELDALLLCGLSLTHYGAVCTEERASDFSEIAEYTYNTLARKCGAYEKMRFGTPESARHELVFQKSTEQNIARIFYDGEDIIISAPNTYGMCIAAQRFLSDAFASVTDKRASLSLDEEICLDCTAPAVTLGAVLSEFSVREAVLHNSEVLIDAAEAADSPLLYFGAMEPSTWDIVKFNLEGNQNRKAHQMLEYTLHDGSITAFAFDESVFEYLAFEASAADGFTLMTIELRYIADGQVVRVCVLAQKNGSNPSAAEAALNRLSKQSDNILVLFVGNGNSTRVVCADTWQLSEQKENEGNECSTLTVTAEQVMLESFFD